MVTMEVTEHHISRGFQHPQYFLPDTAAHRYLQGMGKQAVPHDAQRDARVNNNAPAR